jgi:hypothetical protein
MSQKLPNPPPLEPRPSPPPKPPTAKMNPSPSITVSYPSIPSPPSEPKFCKDCKHFREGPQYPYCLSPNLYPDMIYGLRMERAEDARYKCGINDAKWFEPKVIRIRQPAESIAHRVFRFFKTYYLGSRENE